MAAAAADLWRNNPVAVTSLAASALVGLLWWGSASSHRRLRPKRRWSITSTTMGLGAYHPSINSPEAIINACIVFQNCPTVDDVVKLVVPKMLEYKRMATIPMLQTSSERPCVDLDPSELVRQVEVEGDDEAMYEKVKGYLHEPLTSGRGDLPWWEVVIINNKGSGKSCALWRVHHCLADGISMVALVEQFITYVDGSPMECLLPPGMNKKFKIKKPWYRLMSEVLWSTVKVLSMPSSTYDHPTVFSKGNNKDMIHSQNRELVRFVDTPFDFVKEIKNAANVTVNDVLYTCLSQAIHDYLVNEKCPVLVQHGSKLQCRSLMPVAFPRPPAVMQDKEQTLRNNWCFVETDFFVGHKDITERLKLVNAHMMALKTSPLAMVQLKIQNSLPLVLPLGFNRKVVFDTMSKRSLVFSNVPGPTKPCLFAGKEVVGVQMFFSNLISQIGFISYRGEIFGNICVDPEEVPNCKSLSIFYSRALVQLAGSLNVHVPDVVAKHAEQALV